MQKPEFVLESETHKILRHFDIQTNYPIQARIPDKMLINKKKRTCHIVDIAATADHIVKIKESEKID